MTSTSSTAPDFGTCASGYWRRRFLFEGRHYLLQHIAESIDLIQQHLAGRRCAPNRALFYEERRTQDAVLQRSLWFAESGAYQKWAGLERLVIDWEDNGSRLLLRPFLEAGLLAMNEVIKKWWMRLEAASPAP